MFSAASFSHASFSAVSWLFDLAATVAGGKRKKRVFVETKHGQILAFESEQDLQQWHSTRKHNKRHPEAPIKPPEPIANYSVSEIKQQAIQFGELPQFKAYYDDGKIRQLINAFEKRQSAIIKRRRDAYRLILMVA